MRWNREPFPLPGQRRETVKFAWLPVELEGPGRKVVWLERYRLVEEYYLCMWIPIRAIDMPPKDTHDLTIC